MVELVKLRASQINGCAYCIDMHTKDARSHGESEQRLYGITAGRETPFYSERERAALSWTETLPRISETEEGVFYAFPRPEQAADMNIEELRGMGFSYRKASYLTRLARAVVEKEFDLKEIERLDD